MLTSLKKLGKRWILYRMVWIRRVAIQSAFSKILTFFFFDGFWILTRIEPKSFKNFQYPKCRQPIFDTSLTVLIAFLPVADAFLPVANQNNSKTDKNRNPTISYWNWTERHLIGDASVTVFIVSALVLIEPALVLMHRLWY